MTKCDSLLIYRIIPLFLSRSYSTPFLGYVPVGAVPSIVHMGMLYHLFTLLLYNIALMQRIFRSVRNYGRNIPSVVHMGKVSHFLAIRGVLASNINRIVHRIGSIPCGSKGSWLFCGMFLQVWFMAQYSVFSLSMWLNPLVSLGFWLGGFRQPLIVYNLYE